MRLALGRVDSSPFDSKEITQLKADVVASLHGGGTRNQNFDRGLPGCSVGLSLLGTTSRCSP